MGRRGSTPASCPDGELALCLLGALLAPQWCCVRVPEGMERRHMGADNKKKEVEGRRQPRRRHQDDGDGVPCGAVRRAGQLEPSHQ